MSAAVAPGNPVAAPPAALAEAPPVAAPEGHEPGSAEPEDVVGLSRAKARELLFSGKSDEEVDADATDHVAKPKAKAEPEKPKAEPEKPKEDVDIEISRRYAKVDAQEKRLKEHRKEFETEKNTFTTERESLLKEKQELESVKNNPIDFLSKAGWSKEKIVEWIQGDGRVDPEILVKQLDEKHQRELAELRAERQREKDEFETEQEGRRRQRDLQRVEGELNTEVKSLVMTDAELGVLKRLIDKKPEKFEAFVQKRVGAIIAEVWTKTLNKGEHEGTGRGEVVDPRDALLYLQRELAELQLDSPGQVPAVKSANPAAVEPTPITNHATSQRTVQAVTYDETDPEARRARAAAILAGEIEPE
jgi:hypothetical protein